MNIDLFNNSLLSDVSPAASTPKPPASTKDKQNVPEAVETPVENNNTDNVTTYNTEPGGQKTSNEEPLDFDETIKNAIKNETSRESEANKQTKTQDPASGTLSKTPSDDTIANQQTQISTEIIGKTVIAAVENIASPETTGQVKADSAKAPIDSKETTQNIVVANTSTQKVENQGDVQTDNKTLITEKSADKIISSADKIILDVTTKTADDKQPTETGQQIDPDTLKMSAANTTNTPEKVIVSADKVVAPIINSDNQPTTANQEVVVSNNTPNQEVVVKNNPPVTTSPNIPQSEHKLDIQQADANSENQTSSEKDVNIQKPAEPFSQQVKIIENSASGVSDSPADPGQKTLAGLQDFQKTIEQPVDSKKEISKSQQLPADTKVSDLALHQTAKTEKQAGNTSTSNQLFVSSDNNQNTFLSQDNTDSNGQMSTQIPDDNIQIPVIEQSSAASASFAKIAANVDTNQMISQQLQESIEHTLRQDSRQFVIHLNPPELGKVVIKFQESGGDITGVLEVDKSQTRYQIQQELPQIIQNLQNAGVQVKRIEVVLTNQQQQGFKEQSMSFAQQGNANQQESSYQGTGQNEPGWTANEKWMTAADSFESDYSLEQQFVTDDAINMLV